MTSSEKPPESAASATGDHPFAEAKVSFAVDCSGSTKGRPLQCELSFIARVSQLLSLERRSTAKVIAWNSFVRQISGLNDLWKISSGSGTDPRCILQKENARNVLRDSSLWFLMTDGLISDNIQQDFAHLIPRAGVHGISCISVIFGKLGGRAQSCDISVGVSVFSICPNALFLFYDTISHDIIIMQTKGIFNALLRGAENPVIDESTSWSSFPRLSLEALPDIIIPASKKLETDQVALQGSLVVDFNDLWANKLNKSQLREIFGNEDNLNTVTMLATSRGQGGRYQHWLQQQRLQVDQPLLKHRPDNFGARDHFVKLAEALTKRQSGSEILQGHLRRAHIDNMRAFLQSCQAQIDESKERDEWVEASRKKSIQAISSAQALTSASGFRARRMTSETQDGLGKIASTAPPLSNRVKNVIAESRPGWSGQDRASTASNATWADGESDTFSDTSSFVVVTPGFARDPIVGSSSSMQPPGPKSQARLEAQAPMTSQNETTAKTQVSVESEDVIMVDAPESNADMVNIVNVVHTIDAAPDNEQPKPTSDGPPQEDSWDILSELPTDKSLQGLLWTPGFSSKHGSFAGPCEICGATGSTLAWLFKREMPLTFPGAVNLAKAPFIFSTGCPPEAKGMLSSLLCCEPCSTYCVSTGHSLNSEPVVAALPLVRYLENKTAYDRVLAKVFPATSKADVAAQLFLSVLIETAATPEGRPRLFDNAANWVVENLVHVVDVTATDETRPPVPLFKFLPQQVLRMRSPAHDLVLGSGPDLLRWPLEGFRLALRAASVCGVPVEDRQVAAFSRYLLALAESFEEGRTRLGSEEAGQRLWNEVLHHELCEEDVSGRGEPLEITLAALKGSFMVSDRTYELLVGMPEVQSVGGAWGGVTRVFLEELHKVASRDMCAGGWQLFKAVVEKSRVQDAMGELEEEV